MIECAVPCRLTLTLRGRPLDAFLQAPISVAGTGVASYMPHRAPSIIRSLQSRMPRRAGFHGVLTHGMGAGCKYSYSCAHPRCGPQLRVHGAFLLWPGMLMRTHVSSPAGLPPCCQ